MISVTEIVMIIAGFAAIILGFVLPGSGSGLTTKSDKELEKQIDEMVERAIRSKRDLIDQMAEEAADDNTERIERALDRISNEKMSVFSEYSDTVMNDIHKNHDEVMFMYEMLNDKHKNLTNAVTEVTKKANEAKQTVLDAQLTAKQAKDAADSLRQVEREVPVRRAEQVQAAVHHDQRVVSPQSTAGYQDERVVTPNIQNATQAKRVVEPEADFMPLESTTRRVLFADENGQTSKNAPKLPEIEMQASDTIKASNDQNTEAQEPAQVETVTGIEKIRDFNNQQKVIPIADIQHKKEVAKQPPAKESTRPAAKAAVGESSPMSQNKQILKMHEAGKSNMVIARELGLGIGEVRLVIDLSNKHRKVK